MTSQTTQLFFSRRNSATNPEILKLARVKQLIVRALLSRYEEYSEFLQYATINREIAQSTYQVQPEAIASLTKGIGRGVSLIPEPSGIARIVGLGVEGTSYLTEAGWAKLNQYRTLHERRVLY